MDSMAYRNLCPWTGGPSTVDLVYSHVDRFHDIFPLENNYGNSRKSRDW
jgi:hypothetical protein